MRESFQSVIGVVVPPISTTVLALPYVPNPEPFKVKAMPMGPVDGVSDATLGASTRNVAAVETETAPVEAASAPGTVPVIVASFQTEIGQVVPPMRTKVLAEL